VIAKLLEVVPWARVGPGWATIAILLAIAGAGLTLLLRPYALLKRLAALAVWSGLLALLVFALRGGAPAPAPLASLAGGHETLLIALGMSLAGISAWLLGGAASVLRERRQLIAPLVFILLAAAIGTITATGLLEMIVWQFAIAGCAIAFVLLLTNPGKADPPRALMLVEAMCIIAAGLSLAILGDALSPRWHGTMISAIGGAVLLVVLGVRLMALIVALPLVARASEPVLAAEIALAAIAVPALLQTLIALTQHFKALMPQAFAIILMVFAIVVMLLGAALAIGARARGPRIGAIAASLAGLALLGAFEGAKSPLFVLIFLGPMPAFLAASSIAGRIDRGGALIVERALTPGADAIGILLAIASLALIGLPPFAGFWPRLLLIEAAWAKADYGIIAATLLCSLVLAFALSRRGYERVPATSGPERRNRPAGIGLRELLVLGVTSGVSLAGGLYPAPLIHMSGPAPGAGIMMRADLTERP